MDNNYNKYTREKKQEEWGKKRSLWPKMQWLLGMLWDQWPFKGSNSIQQGFEMKNKNETKVLTLFLLKKFTTHTLFTFLFYLFFTMKFFKLTLLLDKPAFFHIIFTKIFLPGLIWL